MKKDDSTSKTEQQTTSSGKKEEQKATTTASDRVVASPFARKLAEEKGIDLEVNIQFII